MYFVFSTCSKYKG